MRPDIKARMSRAAADPPTIAAIAGTFDRAARAIGAAVCKSAEAVGPPMNNDTGALVRSFLTRK